LLDQQGGVGLRPFQAAEDVAGEAAEEVGELLLGQVAGQADGAAARGPEVALEAPALPERGQVTGNQVRFLPGDDLRVGPEQALYPGGAAALGADDEDGRTVEQSHGDLPGARSASKGEPKPALTLRARTDGRGALEATASSRPAPPSAPSAAGARAS